MSLNGWLSQTCIRVSLWCGILALAIGSGQAAAPNQGTSLGAEDESKEISLTIWLNLHNKADLDAMVHEMYDKDSPYYHHWLTMEQYKARFAPTAQDTAVVRDFLASH